VFEARDVIYGSGARACCREGALGRRGNRRGRLRCAAGCARASRRSAGCVRASCSICDRRGHRYARMDSVRARPIWCQLMTEIISPDHLQSGDLRLSRSSGCGSR
jgi:hypothetical protein